MVAVTARSLARLDSDVTLSQYRALVSLVSLGPQRTSDLAQELGVATSTATRLADRLVGKGLVVRTQRRDDLRATWIGLTCDGKALLGQAMKLRRAEIRALLRSLPTGERNGRGVTTVLNAFAEVANEPTEEDWWNRWQRCDQSASSHESLVDPQRGKALR
ncbi:MarR family transcriptional regulator [Saccharopolyspora elongata]|uniref:MarR family transcriptional regulator n=1 Tax=Saccharopolyspora elongata TaxID=2530387 RepID=A0A4R4ZDB6_9PSEU|nr:MarR family transcriptional regulator [Saccharopolyspora elongata]